MIRPAHVVALAAGTALLIASGASAQLNQQWLTFTHQPSRLAVSPLAISDMATQVSFRTGDLDKDGWDDVVAVRKQQASSLGKRTAFLLMNEGGVLTDRTAQYATATDVAGDQGFLTPVNCREAAIGDVNGDTWPDVVTACALSDGDTKVISHPRVYINLGEDVGGNWQGLRFENGRIPQLLVAGSGLPVAPRFCSLALGDVTGDGFADLYFVDYDDTDTGLAEPATDDLNDRLLVNDGNGFFSDQSATRLTSVQLESEFGIDAAMYDVNADGHLDLVKDTTRLAPIYVGVIYNNPADPGNFTGTGLQKAVNGGAPYGIDLGNLNNDAIVDMAVADEGQDVFMLGTGYDALNQVIWGPHQLFSFNAGAGNEQGHVHSAYIRDLDNDGWNDVLTTDVHGDIPGCFRRMNLYHNLGTTPGQQVLVLKEEAELASGNYGAGWKGAVGLTVPDVRGTYDVAFGDYDKDGDTDLVIATCSLGARYWQNETATTVCQVDMGLQGPGSMEFSICGEDLTTAGSVATLSLTGAAAFQPVFLPISLAFAPTPVKGGLLGTVPILTIVTALSTDGTGSLSLPIPGGASSPLHIYMQCIVKNGSVFEFSNCLDVHIGF